MRRTQMLGLVGVIAFTGVAVSPVEAGTHPRLTDEELVEYVDADYLATLYDQSQGFRAQNSNLLQPALELVDANKGAFLGVRVGNDGSLEVLSVSDAADSLAREKLDQYPSWRLVRVALSQDEVHTLGRQLFSDSGGLGSGMFSWGPDLETGGMRVSVSGQVSSDERVRFESLANRLQVHLRVFEAPVSDRTLDEDRRSDTSPYDGGAWTTRSTSDSPWVLAEGNCSSGFGYRKGGTEYILTAGHCVPKGSDIRHTWSGPPAADRYVGWRSRTTYAEGEGTVPGDNGYHGDLALVNVGDAGRASSRRIWWGTTTTTARIPVSSARVARSGDPVCINGQKSGSDCGLTALSFNTTVVSSDGDVLYPVDEAFSPRTADCSQGGDSGGSVILNHSGPEDSAVAVGIVSGHYETERGCIQVFTGVEEAVQDWGGGVSGT